VARQHGHRQDVRGGAIPEDDFSWYRSSYLFGSKAGEDVTNYILDGAAQLKHLIGDIHQPL
ncbi:hypothetical protein IMZ48_18685, partial [Candidatus Bathyarchaeota archaeon]|nr:hypothetical protein [Candidatus Bathyarchaeota archaeon]